MAGAILRAVRAGEAEAVPRVTDLEFLETSILGKLELEYAGAERSESEIVSELIRRAVKLVFDARVAVESLEPVVQAFIQGWKVELSASMPSAEVLAGLDEIAGLRESASRLADGDSPARLASAVSFILEGLHLSNRLNKTALERGARYAGA